MTRMRNRGGSSLEWNSFSFIIPFVIAFIVLIIVIRYVFSDSSPENPTGSFMTVTPMQEQSEIYIYMSGDSKKRLDGATKMYATDSKLTVSSGEAEVSFENIPSKIFIDAGGEMKYEGMVNEKQTVSLENSDMLVDSGMGNMTVKLKNFSVIPNNNSVILLSQNAIASNVYVLKGSVSVEDYSKKSASASVWVGQQLTIMKNDLTNNTFQFASKIEPLSDYIRTIDLFIKHNGETLLSSIIGGDITENTTVSWSTIKSTKTGIIITSPEDESSVETQEVDIEGKFTNSQIVKITLDDKEALMDKEQKSFIYKGFPLANAVNDIVYKWYDSEGNFLSDTRGVLTIYTSKKEIASKKPSVTTYPISDKDFRIISPVENPYKTTDDVVRIEGRVNKGIVKYITVNDYRLSKFPPLGTSWYYFANKDYETMNDGINLYTIKYYGTNDDLLFTNLFTIVKEKKEEPIIPVVTPVPTVPTDTTETTATGGNMEG